MELLLDLVVSLLFEFVFAAGEYAFYKTHRRVWMWIFGLIGIGAMVWWRGPGFWTTWAIAAGWLAVLVYLDSRLGRRNAA